MSTITSSSTPADIEAAYLDNCTYEEDSSVAKAKAFISACKALILKRPSRISKQGGGDLTWDFETIKAELDAARTWLATSPTALAASGGGVIHSSLEDYRT